MTLDRLLWVNSLWGFALCLGVCVLFWTSTPLLGGYLGAALAYSSISQLALRRERHAVGVSFISAAVIAAYWTPMTIGKVWPLAIGNSAVSLSPATILLLGVDALFSLPACAICVAFILRRHDVLRLLRGRSQNAA
jgi:hypothetical protein